MLCMALSADDWDDVNAALDRFEVRSRLKLALIERRIYRSRQAEIRRAMLHDEPGRGYSHSKPTLTEYDGHQETHGQDL